MKILKQQLQSGMILAALMFLNACGLPPRKAVLTSTVLTSPLTSPQAIASQTNPAPTATTTSHPTTLQPIATQPIRASRTPTITMARRESPQPQILTITILYDNLPYDARLKTAWGFSALVELGDHTLLFDTGGDGPNLMYNFQVLGIDPHKIDSLVISHAHSDHTGGITVLLESGARPNVFLLAAFPVSLKRQISRTTHLVAAEPGQRIAEKLFTTGSLGQSTPEQALIIQAGDGLVVMTGCAHPGIIRIIEKASELFHLPVWMVLGGFHLVDATREEIKAIISNFRQLGVRQVAPSHCTGETAIEMFAAEYGNDFLPSGAGRVIEVPQTP